MIWLPINAHFNAALEELSNYCKKKWLKNRSLWHTIFDDFIILYVCLSN